MDLNLLYSCLEIISQPCFVLSENEVIYSNPALLQELDLKEVTEVSHIFDGKVLVNESDVKLNNGRTARLSVKNLGSSYTLVTLVISDNIDILHTQRLITLGTLAGGVAHDFNNILAGILGHTTFLKSLFSSEVKAQESLFAIEEVSKRASFLVKQIVNFSRQSTSYTEDIEKLSLNNKLIIVSNLLRPVLSGRIKLECTLPKEEHYIYSVHGRVLQVIINLLMNSKDACENGGDISIALQSVYRENKHFSQISVVDTGIGMPQEVLSHVFDAYYTYGKKYGTGFGLHIVKNVIEALNGYVNISSKVGSGTAVTILIPSETEATNSPQVSPDLVKGTEKILVIDDEDSVRSVVGLSLKHLGYEVTMAEGGRTALGILETDPNYDLVLLDMLMPKMSGEQVFDKLKVLYPDIKVLIMSGFTSEASVNKILAGGGKGFLPKPFTIQQLSVAIRKCFS